MMIVDLQSLLLLAVVFGCSSLLLVHVFVFGCGCCWQWLLLIAVVAWRLQTCC